MVYYLFIFLISLILAVLLGFLVKKIAVKFNVLDNPDSVRKIHQKPIPLLGGTAIFLSFFILAFLFRNELLQGDLELKHWIGFFIGACFLIFGGFLDDKYKLSPTKQLIWPILAIFAVILGGIGVEKITNPLGGLIFLDQYKFLLYKIGDYDFSIVLISDFLTFFWLMLMMYTTKLLDGIDGLVTGISAIGAAIIFLFTMTTQYFQPDIGIASLILLGSCVGFLIFNWYPAKIFLGEGGSLFLGFTLGILAIISGGKIAIALLVLGLPLLDLFWTIFRRLLSGKNPFKVADKLHFHHKLLALGLSQRQTVAVFYAISLFFGLSGLFLQSSGKIIALIILFLMMSLIIVGVNLIKKNAKI